VSYPKTVGVLALQGDSANHLELLADLGVEGVAVRAPGDLGKVDALVLPGGESTAISLLLGSSGLLEALRERLGEGMAALGTCAGMILLAREVIDGRPDQVHLDALDMVVRRNAFGRQVDSFEADLEVRGLEGGPLHAVFIRAPVVESTGPGVETLEYLAGADGVQRPVLCCEGAVMAAAFHPELTGDSRLHRLFLERAGG
jgi:5'-phosphate synthase pdxT subunit